LAFAGQKADFFHSGSSGKLLFVSYFLGLPLHKPFAMKPLSICNSLKATRLLVLAFCIFLSCKKEDDNQEIVPTINHPPIANAGNDATIVLPSNTVNLNGSLSSDPDNNIRDYLWTKISGPSSFTISNVNAAQTPVVNLVQGVYLFELKVTDAGALYDRDTLVVTVMAVNQPPACTNCKIVFVSNRDGNAEIYSCNADGSAIVRLTHNDGTDDQPQWSPTGSHIAFISDRTGHPEIYIMNADGSNVVRKTFSGGSQHPTWSPDGKRIAYSTLSNGSANIWVVGAASGSPSLLFEKPGVEDHPSWSPDGTRMVLFSDWNAYDFVYDIYTINSDGTNFAGLTGDMFDRVDYLNPSWSPDGTRIAMAISKTEGTQVGIMNPDGSGLTAIISGAAPRTRTSWSVDGTKIAYTSLSESRNDISWVSADGSTSGTIVTNGRNADW
jgi:Tol biopolymer transport system component